MQKGVPRPRGSAALLVLPDGGQWHRRVPLLPLPPLTPGCLAPDPKCISFLVSGAVGAAGLRRNIAERLRNAELELLHVLVEAAHSPVPASHPAPPAWLYGPAGAGPLPSDSLLDKIRCRSYLSITDCAPDLLRSMVGSSPHQGNPLSHGGPELAAPAGHAQAHCAAVVEGGCQQVLHKNLRPD